MFIIPAKQLASFIPGLLRHLSLPHTSDKTNRSNNAHNTTERALTRVLAYFAYVYCVTSVRVLNILGKFAVNTGVTLAATDK